jgi:antitoxin component YwqK of YwqJK toxin-antitoxin module
MENSPYIKEHVEYFDDGKIRVQYFYQGDKKLVPPWSRKFEGYCREWYSNGQLCTESFYRDDKRDGECKSWYPDGQICYREFFQNGKLKEGKYWYSGGELMKHEYYQTIGEFKFWYENGQMKEYAFYLDKELGSTWLHGKYKRWHENGNIWGQSFFRDGDREGESREWNKNGRLLEREYWKDGKVINSKFEFSDKMSFLRLKRGINMNNHKHHLPKLDIFLIPDLISML